MAQHYYSLSHCLQIRFVCKSREKVNDPSLCLTLEKSYALHCFLLKPSLMVMGTLATQPSFLVPGRTYGLIRLDYARVAVFKWIVNKSYTQINWLNYLTYFFDVLVRQLTCAIHCVWSNFNVQCLLVYATFIWRLFHHNFGLNLSLIILGFHFFVY